MTTQDHPEQVQRLPAHEQSRYGAAAECALRTYPGPVGELIYRELIAYARFGRCFAKDALIPRLMTQMLIPPGPHPGTESTSAPASLLTEPGPVLWPAPARGVRR